MRTRCLIVFVLLLAVATGVCFASGEGAATLYNQGNALYAKGDFEGAVKTYLHALEQRVADPRLEQNIGSAYLKLGDVGRAIYHFERGLLLGPRDPDLRHNLEFAQSLRPDEIPEHGLFVTRLFDRIMRSFTAGEWVAVGSLMFVAISVLLLVLMFVQGRARPVLWWCVVVGLIWLVFVSPFMASRLHHDHFVDRAIVVAEKTTARSGPGEDQSEAFIVHGGMPCTVHEKRAGWSRVTIETGLSGWLPTPALKQIRF